MSSVMDWVNQALHAETRCLDKANSSRQVKAIDAMTFDLARNWNPTGFYTPAQIHSIVSAVTSLNGAARTVLASLSAVQHSTSDADQVIKQAAAYLDRNDARAQAYITAASKAGSTGVVNAPGLKMWVTNSLVNISQAYVTVYVLDCNTTWLDYAAAASKRLVDAAKAIGGVIADAATAIVDAAESTLQFASALKWIIVGTVLLMGGAFIYKKSRRFYRHQIAPRISFDDDEEA